MGYVSHKRSVNSWVAWRLNSSQATETTSLETENAYFYSRIISLHSTRLSFQFFAVFFWILTQPKELFEIIESKVTVSVTVKKVEEFYTYNSLKEGCNNLRRFGQKVKATHKEIKISQTDLFHSGPSHPTIINTKHSSNVTHKLLLHENLSPLHVSVLSDHLQREHQLPSVVKFLKFF
jgi:hypothetical protein